MLGISRLKLEFLSKTLFLYVVRVFLKLVPFHSQSRQN